MISENIRMKNTKIKYILIFLLQIILVVLLGIIVNLINVHIFIKLVIYILLVPIILQTAKILYNLFDISLKPIILIDFVLLGVSFLSVTDRNGNLVTSSTHIGNLNPFGYRGYYIDTETGLYYFISR